jgi:hypothetical protein
VVTFEDLGCYDLQDPLWWLVPLTADAVPQAGDVRWGGHFERWIGEQLAFMQEPARAERWRWWSCRHPLEAAQDVLSVVEELRLCWWCTRWQPIGMEMRPFPPTARCPTPVAAIHLGMVKVGGHATPSSRLGW